MQLQEQVSVVSSAVVSWIGTELTSVLQLLFFLTLGYTVTRTWIFTRRFGQNKARAKKLDDIDLVLEEIQGTSCSESDTTPMVKSKSSRLSNAAERKSKKAKVKATESDAPEPAPALLEELPQEPLPEQRTEQSTPEKIEAPDKATEGTIQSSAEESPAPVSERVAKMMAKKMQRKAKKEQEKTAVEDEAVVEEKSEDCDVEKPKVEPPIVALVETVTDAEAVADDMAQTLSTHSMTKVTPKSHKKNKKATTRTPIEKALVEKAPIENTPVVENTSVVEESVEEEICSPIPSIHKSLVSVESLANMETDAHSESEEVHSSQPGISTPEHSLTPPPAELCNVDPQPFLWGGAGVPQIEGWVAVAMPAEYAPAGAPGPFDGLWKNNEGEKIVVDHEEILFESGMKWVMEMQSLTSLSVSIGKEVFSAELDAAGQELVWSDGDVWKCVGQTDAQQQWAAAREAEGMPCVLLGGEQMFTMIDPMMMPQDSMPMMTMPATQIPEDAKEWETCYDWAKKGWCKWGAACEWYHPGQPQMQFQGSCQPCAPDAPFFGF
jgi:hypothetical protein